MTFDAPAIQATTAPIKVAIIEDLREVREGLAMLINGTSGFSCVGSFRSMETAIANLGDVDPDVILTDIGLPGMDGFAVARALRSDPRTAKTYMIAQSGYGQADDIRKSLASGFNIHLVKPVDFTELSKVLNSRPENAI